jgi:16S rRNA (cytosine967-C5)-methyltransferase
VRRETAFSGAVVAAELGRARLRPDDAALATRLAYGTLAAEGVLDGVIDRFAKGALEPRVRDSLRLGAYELLFSRVPVYAVVDQTVGAVRQVRPQAASLANAVMRRIAEVAPEFPFGDPATDLDALARATGHPRWIADVAFASLGDAAARDMLAAGLEPAPTYVRLDPFAESPAVALAALAAAGAGPEPSPPDPDCYLLARPGAVVGEGLGAGAFAMDAAAQIAPAAVAPAPGEHVADVGAGRGNKTVCLQSLAVRAGGSAAITALENHAGKVERLRARLDASGVPGVVTLVCDALDLADTPGYGSFDAVLLDTPCTGLGTLRRYPEKRWRLHPDDLTRMAELQSALLASVATAVRPGGRVVYSTCSIAAAENGDVLHGFLQGPGAGTFALERLDGMVPQEWKRYVDPSGCFQSWPITGGPDGHYVARLCRIGV